MWGRSAEQKWQRGGASARMEPLRHPAGTWQAGRASSCLFLRGMASFLVSPASFDKAFGFISASVSKLVCIASAVL